MGMLSATGKLRVDSWKQRITVDLSWDFSQYYIWFVNKELKIHLDTPRFIPHITISNDKLHRRVRYKDLEKFDGQTIQFDYDPNLILGGSRKKIVMYYVMVFSKEIEQLKAIAKIKEGPSYKGMHVTIGNAKGGLRPYWPKMIEIR